MVLGVGANEEVGDDALPLAPTCAVRAKRDACRERARFPGGRVRYAQISHRLHGGVA